MRPLEGGAMLQKTMREDGKVEVTFRMPPLDGVVELNLRGDFNGWAVKGVPLRLESDGTWVATLVLDAGKSYRFRYCDNQGTWHNDWEADAYLPNEFGSDDSVVDLTTGGAPSAQRGNARPDDKVTGPTRRHSGHPRPSHQHARASE
jgi:1,4-alpha-glucan branching enzyme